MSKWPSSEEISNSQSHLTTLKANTKQGQQSFIFAIWQKKTQHSWNCRASSGSLSSIASLRLFHTLRGSCSLTHLSRDKVSGRVDMSSIRYREGASNMTLDIYTMCMHIQTLSCTHAGMATSIHFVIQYPHCQLSFFFLSYYQVVWNYNDLEQGYRIFQKCININCDFKMIQD